jgi:hypothetical protein
LRSGAGAILGASAYRAIGNKRLVTATALLEVPTTLPRLPRTQKLDPRSPYHFCDDGKTTNMQSHQIVAKLWLGNKWAGAESVHIMVRQQVGRIGEHLTCRA